MTKSISKREQKNFTFEIKDFDDALGIVKGYLATFDNIDETGDRIRPGAFKRTLQSKYQYKQAHNKTYLMPLLWQHDIGTPVGGYTEAKEDKIGLYVEFQIDMDIQRGKEAYSGLKKGYIFQQSIGYDTIQSEYVKEPDGKMVRDLLEIRLWEGSIVTFPANELAVVTSVKASEGKPMNEQDQSPRRQKTLLEHYNEEVAQDLMEDLQNVYVCALIKSIFDAFTIGDQPQADVSEALDAFKELMMSKFVTQAIDCNLSEYLSGNGFSYTPGLGRMLSGSDDDSYYGDYGYMSRRSDFAHKAGKAGKPISAANQGHIDDHVAALHDRTDNAIKAMKTAMQHMKAVHAQADNFADTMSGGKDDEEEEKPDGKESDGKSMESALTLIKGLRGINE